MPASPMSASGAMMISSQAIATSTACPLIVRGIYATVLTPLNSELVAMNFASTSARPKSLPLPASDCPGTNSNTMTGRGPPRAVFATNWVTAERTRASTLPSIGTAICTRCPTGAFAAVSVAGGPWFSSPAPWAEDDSAAMISSATLAAANKATGHVAADHEAIPHRLQSENGFRAIPKRILFFRPKPPLGAVRK